MSVVWVNLHAGELVGVAMIFACAVLLLLVRRDLRGGGWCLAALVLAVRSRPPVLRYLHSRRIVLYLGLAAGTVVALPSLGHIGRPGPAYYSTEVVRDIPPHCRLFNTDILGGFVILERPDVPVSLDTRNDLYGRQGHVTSGLAGADCVLLPQQAGSPSGSARAEDGN